MATDEEVMAVDKRLARLEETVAKEFLAQKGRFDKIDLELRAHNERFDKIDLELRAHNERFDKIDDQLHAHTGRFDRLEDRMVALESKVDVFAESIRGDIKTVLEVVTGFTAEMRRTTESIREEHAADRRLTRLTLLDHVTRIRTLEGEGPAVEPS